MFYKLLLQNEVDGLKTRTWKFKAPTVLGREPGSGLCIDHDSISRKHCQFSLNGDGALVIKDLGSMNGIYVDDNRVDHQVLMPHQIIQIGALRLQVEFSTEDEVAAAPRQQPKGSVGTTQPMKTYRPPEPVQSFRSNPVTPEKPWWRRIIG